MPRRSAYRICLPNFCGLAATSVGMPRRRRRLASSWAAGRASSSASATSTALETARLPASTPSLMSGTSVRETPKEIADAGVRRLAVAGQGVVAAAAGDGLQPLVAGHEDLEHGAGVVVEAAGDAQVRLDRDVVGDRGRAAVDDRGQLRQAGLQQVVLDAESRGRHRRRTCRRRGCSPAPGTSRPARAWRPAVSTSSAATASAGCLSSLSMARIAAGTSGMPRPR